ncbi:MAG: 5-bromo-4-chloroindolyl phosphate hydrolysis family protein [Bacillota bacterium]|nr:5-bromo-4-chloroindolyl phosphate hydrolysis family protein [Bacillota bacterium]
MKKDKGIRKFGWARAFVVFWLGILGIGYLGEITVVGIIFILAMLYVIFMDVINEKIFGRSSGGASGNTAEPLYDPSAHGELVKCPYCGKSIPSDIKFCFYCGASLEAFRRIEDIRCDSTGRMNKAAKALDDSIHKERILKIKTLTNKILKKYAEQPDNVDDSSKFTDYYLPKTVSAIEHYQTLCGLDNLDEEQVKIKSQIEESLEMIEEAFSNILNRISTKGLVDISADVSVLETIMKQDGLANSDFDVDCNKS